MDVKDIFIYRLMDCECQKRVSMRKCMLDEVNQYRKMGYPKELCDIAEKQVPSFYQNHHKNEPMFRTATMQLLWLRLMTDSSIVKGYSS